MSIFESIKNAIFGHGSAAATHGAPGGSSAPASSAPRPASPSARPAGAPAASTSAAAPGAASSTTAPATPPSAPAQPVDVAAKLDSLVKESGQKLEWRTSIVDLMKLLKLDSSLEHRKALAAELGYTGNTADSAAMNVWLHRQVMAKLAASGGKVPDNLH
jgi:hypothetical protein